MLAGIYCTDAVEILKNSNLLPQLIEINFKQNTLEIPTTNHLMAHNVFNDLLFISIIIRYLFSKIHIRIAC